MLIFLYQLSIILDMQFLKSKDNQKYFIYSGSSLTNSLLSNLLKTKNSFI